VKKGSVPYATPRALFIGPHRRTVAGMSLPLRDRKLTVEDLYTMPDDGFKYELEAGMLVSEPLPGFRHGRVMVRTAEILSAHVRKNGLGVILAGDSGFILARKPDTVRGPDVAFVSKQRFEERGDTIKAFSGAPDLAVEVLSPSNTPAGIRAKVADYFAAGSRCVWVIDAEARSVTVYAALLSPHELGEDEILDGGDVLPGFAVRVGEIFEL
jgi:Uma2 family endonuclease